MYWKEGSIGVDCRCGKWNRISARKTCPTSRDPFQFITLFTNHSTCVFSFHWVLGGGHQYRKERWCFTTNSLYICVQLLREKQLMFCTQEKQMWQMRFGAYEYILSWDLPTEQRKTSKNREGVTLFRLFGQSKVLLSQKEDFCHSSEMQWGLLTWSRVDSNLLSELSQAGS